MYIGDEIMDFPSALAFWWDYTGRNCDIFQLDKKIQITRLDHP